MTSLSGVKRSIRRSGLFLLVLAILTLYGIEAHGRRRMTNTPANQADQGAYLAYAQRMHDTHYAGVGERNRMPIYPFLLSFIYRNGLSQDEFLERAQVFNVNLSIVLLFLFFLIARRFFPPLHAVALLVMTAFGVFVYRAGLVQC